MVVWSDHHAIDNFMTDYLKLQSFSQNLSKNPFTNQNKMGYLRLGDNPLKNSGLIIYIDWLIVFLIPQQHAQDQ